MRRLPLLGLALALLAPSLVVGGAEALEGDLDLRLDVHGHPRFDSGATRSGFTVRPSPGAPISFDVDARNLGAATHAVLYTVAVPTAPSGRPADVASWTLPTVVERTDHGRETLTCAPASFAGLWATACPVRLDRGATRAFEIEGPAPRSIGPFVLYALLWPEGAAEPTVDLTSPPNLYSHSQREATPSNNLLVAVGAVESRVPSYALTWQTPATAEPGQPFETRAIVVNEGADAVGPMELRLAPGGTAAVVRTVSCPGTRGLESCSLDGLLQGERAQIVWRVNATRGSLDLRLAPVGLKDENLTATRHVQVGQAFAPSLRPRVVGPSSLVGGTVGRFVVEVANAGDGASDATEATLALSMDATFALLPPSCEAGLFETRCAVPAVAPGDAARLEVEVAMPQDAPGFALDAGVAGRTTSLAVTAMTAEDAAALAPRSAHPDLLLLAHGYGNRVEPNADTSVGVLAMSVSRQNATYPPVILRTNILNPIFLTWKGDILPSLTLVTWCAPAAPQTWRCEMPPGPAGQLEVRGKAPPKGNLTVSALFEGDAASEVSASDPITPRVDLTLQSAGDTRNPVPESADNGLEPYRFRPGTGLVHTLFAQNRGPGDTDASLYLFVVPETRSGNGVVAPRGTETWTFPRAEGLSCERATLGDLPATRCPIHLDAGDRKRLDVIGDAPEMEGEFEFYALLWPQGASVPTFDLAHPGRLVYTGNREMSAGNNFRALGAGVVAAPHERMTLRGPPGSVLEDAPFVVSVELLNDGDVASEPRPIQLNLTGAVASANVLECASPMADGSCMMPALEPGRSAIARWTLTSEPGRLQVMARNAAGQDVGVLVDVTSPEPPRFARLEATLAGPSTTAAPFAETFTVEVRNLGDGAATTAMVHLQVDRTARFTAQPEGCFGTAASLDCALGLIAPGETRTLSYRVGAAIVPMRPLASQAYHVFGDLDGAAMATLTVTPVQPRADLALVSLEVSDATPRLGDTVTLTATVENLGGDDVTSGWIYTALPDGMAFPDDGRGPCVKIDANVRCFVGAITAGARIRASLDVVAAQLGVHEAQVFVGGNAVDGNAANNAQRLSVDISAA